MKISKSLIFVLIIAVSFCSCGDDDLSTSLNWEYVDAWGSSGTGDGQFSLIGGLYADDAGSVYASDINLSRVQKFTNTGEFLLKWGGPGSGPGQFSTCREIASDNDGNILVLDQDNCRAQRFTSSGSYISQIGGSCGSGSGQLDVSYLMTIDGNNNVYILDEGNELIQKFNVNGTPVLSWTSNTPWGFVTDLCTDQIGDLFVLFLDFNTQVSTVVQYSPEGTLKSSWTIADNTSYTTTMAFDSEENLHVGFEAGYIKIYSKGGTYLNQYGTPGTDEGQLLTISNISFGSNDDLYVSNCIQNTCRISKFRRKN